MHGSCGVRALAPAQMRYKFAFGLVFWSVACLLFYRAHTAPIPREIQTKIALYRSKKCLLMSGPSFHTQRILKSATFALQQSDENTVSIFRLKSHRKCIDSLVFVFISETPLQWVLGKPTKNL